MKELKTFGFLVEFTRETVDAKTGNKITKVYRRVDYELSTYLAGAIRKWQQNHSNATIIGIVKA